MKRAIARAMPLALSLLLLLLIWYWGAAQLGNFLPAPHVVVSTFFDELQNGDLWQQLRVSGLRVLVSIVLGTALAMPLAVLAAESRQVNRFLSPIIYFLYPVPKIVFIPIIILVYTRLVQRFDADFLISPNPPIVILITIIIFFQIYVIVRDATAQLPAQTLASVRSLGASRAQRLRYVYLPVSLPATVTALKISVGTAVAVLFIAETLVGNNVGLGHYILVEQLNRFAYPELYAGVLALSLLGGLLFIVLTLAESLLTRWQKQSYTWADMLVSLLKPWLLAARPRTLLLAVANIAMGVFLAASRGNINLTVAGLAVLTAILLQILSNLANDYGDTRHGLDNDMRVGPKRAVQSGLVSQQAMLRGVIFTAALSIVSGLGLVITAFGMGSLPLLLLFVLLGGASIWAAIAYTATESPYGYVGLGDLMVFIFFGLIAVLGSYFLQTQSLSFDLLLPAAASGLLSVAVLNVNNVRDLESDKLAGKRSVPVRLGANNARIYHATLLLLSVLLAVAYVLINYNSPWQFLFVLALPLLALNGIWVWQRRAAAELDPLLKQMSISTLVFTLLFSLGQIIA